MFIDPSSRHNDYDVGLHCTPKGVRSLLLLCAINIAPLARWYPRFNTDRVRYYLRLRRHLVHALG